MAALFFVSCPAKSGSKKLHISFLRWVFLTSVMAALIFFVNCPATLRL